MAKMTPAQTEALDMLKRNPGVAFKGSNRNDEAARLVNTRPIEAVIGRAPGLGAVKGGGLVAMRWTVGGYLYTFTP